jgi:hypothetical protein
MNEKRLTGKQPISLFQCLPLRGIKPDDQLPFDEDELSLPPFGEESPDFPSVGVPFREERAVRAGLGEVSVGDTGRFRRLRRQPLLAGTFDFFPMQPANQILACLLHGWSSFRPPRYTSPIREATPVRTQARLAHPHAVYPVILSGDPFAPPGLPRDPARRTAVG